ncbi:MAG TPA: beta-xylosidase [Armatimonadota bacterium]|jgi:xylan 1,4-beta-xylosidase
MKHRTNALPRLLTAAVTLMSASAWGKEPDVKEGNLAVTMKVDASKSLGPLEPAWAYFGYDEPNYTTMEHGRALLKELSALSPVPVYIRTHNLLTSGDGTASLKWGSTNAYTEDLAGRPVYDWTILDRIFDTFRETGVVPLVEIGFMPEALSVKPEPYRHHFPDGEIWAGWGYPPKDYGKWADLVYHWVRHCVDRYGEKAVATWLWEVWNEPDIAYWQGTPEEYFKLYDYSADAVKRALPAARIGGPHSTGPRYPHAADFLRRFLDHCAHGTNYATGKTGSPLDYVGFHPKGDTAMVDGHVRMGIAHQLESIARGFEIVTSFPEYRKTPIILGESDPEGGAAYSAKRFPQNGYRNGSQYPAYTAAVLAGTYDLARRTHANLMGSVTWAFEFEGQPYFEGYRTLATNGIDKPILNLFRMLGLMRGQRLQLDSTGAIGAESLLKTGARERPDISGLASGTDRDISVLLWHYHDDDVAGPAASVRLAVNEITSSPKRVLVRKYAIDEQHSNAFTVWKDMGSPQTPTPAQVETLRAAGQLTAEGSPEWLSVQDGQVDVDVTLPRQSVTLLQLSW